ncbi:MAG: MFS transporter [Alphaproteobacteria bacterium]|nr:MAG: MFS transporter [Alphaproteobacteria bacterium]
MPARRFRIYVLMFLLAAINYIDRSALSVAAAPLAAEFKLDPVQMGYLFSSFLWLYVLCLVPMGWIVDRYGARVVNAVGIAVWSGATVLTGLTGSFGTLVATRVLMGAGEATTYPAAGQVVRQWVPLRERALFTTAFNGGAYFGPAVGNLTLATLIAAAGWRSAFYVCGAVGFVWLAAWLVWYRKPAEASWLGTAERSMLVEQSRVETADTAPRSGLWALLRSPSMIGVMITQGCGVYTQYLFLTWLPAYLQAERGISLAKSGWLTSLPYFGAVVLTVLLGRLSDSRLSPEAVRQGGRRRMVAAMMLVAAVILFAPLVTNVYLILLLITVALSGVATTIGLNIALLSDLLRNTGDAGRATGLLILGGNVFGILAPIVTGYVVQLTGSYDYAFVVAGALLLVGATSALSLTHRPIGA